jgi:hypothetical protein
MGGIMAKVHLQRGFRLRNYKGHKTLCGRELKEVKSTKDVFLVTCGMCRGIKKLIFDLKRR